MSASSQSQTSYNDALDVSRGMVALSQDLTTPRNVYGNRSKRGWSDSYFPSTHSSYSSISDASYNPSYYSGSIASSVSDYGSQSDMESVSSRTLPKPNNLISATTLPAPQSMRERSSIIRQRTRIVREKGTQEQGRQQRSGPRY